jgi:O-methyltransferase/aklanonic acid methyltransferase
MSAPSVLTKQQIEHIYDGAAPSYDRVGPVLYARWGMHLAGLVPLAPGMKVLDVATGKCAVLIEAARRVGLEGHAVGIDISSTMLQEAQTIVSLSGLKNTELRRMDAEHLDFPDGSFDAVTCSFALFMLPDMNGALKEMRRVCKADGYVGLTYFTRTPPPFDPGWPAFAQLCNSFGVAFRMPQQIGTTPEQLEASVREVGFGVLKIETEVSDLTYATKEDWWGFILTQGTRAAVLSMDEESRQRFKEEYFARLSPVLRADGYHMTTGVIYCLAQR